MDTHSAPKGNWTKIETEMENEMKNESEVDDFIRRIKTAIEKNQTSVRYFGNHTVGLITDLTERGFTCDGRGVSWKNPPVGSFAYTLVVK